MSQELLIVTCTRSKTLEEFSSRPIYKSLMYHHDNNKGVVDILVLPNNTEGLPAVYNRVLKDIKNINKTVLFVHDDVELEDAFLTEKLLQSPYEITGLAGTKSFNKGSSQSAWHLSSPKTDYVGEVAHSHQGKVWTTVFGPTQSRALVLDGLFLSCKVKTLVEKNVFFDENFNFHFYDISFCLRANQNKVSCGVLPIRVIHHGLGDSMNTPEWVSANQIFKQNYCI